MLEEHLGYVADAVRIGRFSQALRTVIKPGDRVADLGCGTGILGILALQLGAGHVYGIDESGMVEVARQAAATSGLEDRFSFVTGRSQHTELPELVDVAVCDHVGYFGIDYGIVELLQDARRRLLKPGGALVPARLHLEIAAIESQRCQEKVNGWRAKHVPTGLHSLRGHSVNMKHTAEFRADEVISRPAALGSIDLIRDDREFFSWSTELRMTRTGTVHGLGGWFDCELCEGVRMTNSPVAETPIQRPQVFLPIDEPVEVLAGDLARVTVMARPAEHLIAWTVDIPSSGRRFSHSTWLGMPLSTEELLRADPSRLPKLSREGAARAIVLGYCDGRRTAREIEQAVLLEHPGLFPSSSEISRFVARVLARDTC